MAILSRYSPILSPNSFRFGCLRNNARLFQLQHGTRSFTRTSPARSRRMEWNARSVTNSKVVSKVPYRLAATWLTPDPLNVARIFFQVCAEGRWLTDYRSDQKRLFVDCPAWMLSITDFFKMLSFSSRLLLLNGSEVMGSSLKLPCSIFTGTSLMLRACMLFRARLLLSTDYLARSA